MYALLHFLLLLMSIHCAIRDAHRIYFVGNYVNDLFFFLINWREKQNCSCYYNFDILWFALKWIFFFHIVLSPPRMCLGICSWDCCLLGWFLPKQKILIFILLNINVFSLGITTIIKFHRLILYHHLSRPYLTYHIKS